MNAPNPNLDQLSDAEKRALLLEMMKAKQAKNQSGPLSKGQMRFWMLDQLDRDSATYNLLPYGLRLEGPLDVAVFKQAIQRIYQRHDILRTTFSEQANGPSQQVTAFGELAIDWVDLERDYPDTNPHAIPLRQAAVKKLQTAESKHVFDLGKGPLIRVILIRISEVEHVLLLTMHHIIADAWSIAVIMRELEAAYVACQKNPNLPLKRPAKQYADFVTWEQERFANGVLEQQLTYWEQQLAGLPPLLELPYDRPRPAVQSHQSSEEDFSLNPAVASRLRQMCQQHDVSLTIILIAAFKVLLARYSGSRDIALGQAVSNRNQAEWEQLIGFFVNTIVLRSQLDDGASFITHLLNVKQTLLEAYANKEAPFDKVVQRVGQDRSLAFSPLFQVLFAFVDARTLLRLPELTMTPLREIRTHLQFDLHLLMWDGPTGMRGTMEFNSDIFTRASIRQMLRAFEVLLTQISQNPTARLEQYQLLEPAQQHTYLHTWNATEQPAVPWLPLHRHIEAQVTRTPQAPALFERNQTLSYADFNQAANRMAWHLKKLNLPGHSAIGVCVNRGVGLCSSLLGILKAGHSYLPLDPDHPKNRLNFQIEDANPPLVITEKAFASQFSCPVLLLDDEVLKKQPSNNLPLEVVPQQPAYVLYTSGSTGKPKGAIISHQAIVNRLLWMQKTFALSSQDRLLQKTPYSFDVSLWELFWPFMAGAALVIAEPQRHWDTTYLKDTMAAHKVSCVHFVPSMLALFLEEPGVERLTGLKRVICSGEALSSELSQRFRAKLSGELFNLYGPTEAAVDVSMARAETHHQGPTVPIGKPIDNTQLYITDARLQLLPQGIGGELLIGGVQLAHGYLSRPALTAARFIPNPFGSEPGSRLYRTGDLVRHLPDGAIEYLNRLDHQVKIRGYRIELGEIEACLASMATVRQALVMVQKQAHGHDRLVAYVVREDGGQEVDPQWRTALGKQLPDYMVPAIFSVLPAWPLSANGKIDRKQLTLPEDAAVAQKRQYVAPRTPLEKHIAQLWADLLGIAKVGIHDRFFELGGHSYLLIQMHRQLTQRFDQQLTLVELFQHPTIAQLAAFLQASKTTHADPETDPKVKTKAFEEAIAIIGMAGRFPDANSVEALWENLLNGVESISFFDEATLQESGVSPQEYRAPSYVPAAGILENITDFDANFFGFTPREAEITDPQQRLFLECAYEALENAGHGSEHFPGRIGVFAGTGMSTYFLSNLLSQPGILKSAELYQVMVGNDRNFPATQTSHKMNLSGPSINVANACSSSLIAVHMACKSLLEGESDMALAGGMKVMVPHRVGYHYQEGNIHSPDGHCRTFDAKAKGIVMSSGGGLVVLRRLSDALADGDAIVAVIKGSAINNDGAQKVGFMAPGARGQEDVISSAHQAAQVDPASISYVEAHGTGTTLGDPIEIAALTAAFNRHTDQTGFCAIGSIKTNMGHLDHAAGIAGLIKTIQAVRHRKIPPSLHFEKPNPGIEFEKSPFRVVTEACDWKSEGPLRAGISSFGIGGTNAHVVLEEAPQAASDLAEDSLPQLWVLSAKTNPALEHMSERLDDFLAANEAPPSDVAYTLQLGRNPYPYRQYCVVEPAQEEANAPLNLHWLQGHATGETAYPVFLFPGQGAQHVDMLKGLYADVPVFRKAVDQCAALLQPLLNQDIRELIYPKQVHEQDQERLHQTRFTQPALFTVSYAAAEMLASWGINPKAMLGHSIGEYVAACVAGIFSLEDAVFLVARRGELMQSMAPGSMLAIPKPPTEVTPLLDARFDLAVVNTPNQCVVAGETSALEALQAQLGCGKVLQTSHAFHSKMMEPALASFRLSFEKVKLSPPTIPVIANLTGQWLSDEQAIDPEYWVAQLRQTVLFADGLNVLLQQPNAVFVEVGPSQTLTRLAKACAAEVDVAALSLARHVKQKGHDLSHAYRLLGQLWLRGLQPQWQALPRKNPPKRMALPTYPFERRRFWVSPGEGMEAADNMSRKSKLSEWFYLPSWQQQSPRVFAKPPVCPENSQWLLWSTDNAIARALVAQLQAMGCTVHGADELGSLPETNEDFSTQVSTLDPDKKLNILDLSPLVDDDPHQGFRQVLRPLNALKALVNGGFHGAVNWAFVTKQAFKVLGHEVVNPHQALCAGPVKVFTQEFPNLECSQIDLDDALLQAPSQSAQQILCETLADLPQTIIAHRGHFRWAPTFVAEPLAEETALPKAEMAGTYLITGGLGGIGYTFAKHFAQEIQPTLILTGRKALPSPDLWQDLLAEGNHPQHDAIAKLVALQTAGATVRYRAVDVCDHAAMTTLFDELKREGLTGLIHSAGIAGGGLSLLKTEAATRQVLEPKVTGTLHIAEGIRLLKPNFSLFCSSTTAILGGVGQVDYCAANNFQDAMARSLSDELGIQVVAINWPAWQEVGMAVATEVPAEWRAAHEHNIALGIAPEEGIQALNRILASGLSHIAVSTVDLNRAIAAMQAMAQANPETLLPEPTKNRHERPQLATPFAAPRDELETELAEIWSNFLGIEGIGIHDDFFELGGHSLLATQIVGKIRHQLGAELQLNALFDNPTIASLALAVIEVQAQLGSDAELEAMLAEVEQMSPDEIEELTS